MVLILIFIFCMWQENISTPTDFNAQYNSPKYFQERREGNVDRIEFSQWLYLQGRGRLESTGNDLNVNTQIISRSFCMLWRHVILLERKSILKYLYFQLCCEILIFMCWISNIPRSIFYFSLFYGPCVCTHEC